MYPYTVTPKIHASCISGEKAGCSRQHGKIYSTTSRKYFESVSSQSRLEIMQQVSDNCQSAQRCRKPIMPCSGTSLTHGMSSYSSSYKQTPHRKSQHVPLTTSWLNSPNVSRIGVCNHRNRCKTKNKIIDIEETDSRGQKKPNKCAKQSSKNIKMDVPMDIPNRNSDYQVPNMTYNQNQVDLSERKRNTSDKKVASKVGYRIKRLRTSPATAAAATTTAWVNTLIISWLIVQELFLVCPPCHARSTTVINAGNPDAKRLYDDLLSNYNKLVRPVVNTTDALQVMIKLKLSQLIDVVSRLSCIQTYSNTHIATFFYLRSSLQIQVCCEISATIICYGLIPHC